MQLTAESPSNSGVNCLSIKTGYSALLLTGSNLWRAWGYDGEGRAAGRTGVKGRVCRLEGGRAAFHGSNYLPGSIVSMFVL